MFVAADTFTQCVIFGVFCSPSLGVSAVEGCHASTEFIILKKSLLDVELEWFLVVILDILEKLLDPREDSLYDALLLLTLEEGDGDDEVYVVHGLVRGFQMGPELVQVPGPEVEARLAEEALHHGVGLEHGRARNGAVQ